MPGKRKKSSKKLKQVSLTTSVRLTKLQQAESKIDQLRILLSDYISAVRNRKEVTSFRAFARTEDGKPGLVDVATLIAGVTTAGTLGKDTLLRVKPSNNPKELASLEVVFVDRIPTPPFLY